MSLNEPLPVELEILLVTPVASSSGSLTSREPLSGLFERPTHLEAEDTIERLLYVVA